VDVDVAAAVARHLMYCPRYCVGTTTSPIRTGFEPGFPKNILSSLVSGRRFSTVLPKTSDIRAALATIAQQLEPWDGEAPAFGPTKIRKSRTGTVGPDTVIRLRAHRKHQRELLIANPAVVQGLRPRVRQATRRTDVHCALGPWRALVFGRTAKLPDTAPIRAGDSQVLMLE